MGGQGVLRLRYVKLVVLLISILLIAVPSIMGAEENVDEIEVHDPAGDVWFDANFTDGSTSRDVDITRVTCDMSEDILVLQMSVVGRIRLEGQEDLYNYTFVLIKEGGERDNIFITSDIDWSNYPHPVIASVRGDGTSRLTVEYNPWLIEQETGEEYVVSTIMASSTLTDGGKDLAFDLVNGTTPTDDVEIGVISSTFSYVEASSSYDLEAKIVGTSSGGSGIWIGWSADYNDGYFSSVQWYKSTFNEDGVECEQAHLMDTSEDSDLTSYEFWVLSRSDGTDHLKLKELIEGHGGLRTVYVHIVIFPTDDITLFSEKKVNVEFTSSFNPSQEDENGNGDEGFPLVFLAMVGALILAGVIVWWRDRKEEEMERKEENDRSS